MEYDVTARTKKEGYLRFEFRLNTQDEKSQKVYDGLIKDESLTVKIVPVQRDYHRDIDPRDAYERGNYKRDCV